MNILNTDFTNSTDTMNSSTSPINFIFIDGSYFNFYRYCALLSWWKNAFPEHLDEIIEPFQNPQFVAKFRKLFVENVKGLPKKLGLDKVGLYKVGLDKVGLDKSRNIMIVGKDCKRENIWRTTLFPAYKGTRDNSPESGFKGGPFFKMVYEDDLFLEGGAKAVLKHPSLEADDCIAISTKLLLEKYPTCSIYIITGDKDYLQLASSRVHLFNLAFKRLNEQKSSYNDAAKDLFCKIVTGDPSDNIPPIFKGCGPKTAVKYFENMESFLSKLEADPEAKKRYELNNTLINFNNIPEHLVQEFLLNC
jgi:5'-3' exonuclease